MQNTVPAGEGAMCAVMAMDAGKIEEILADVGLTMSGVFTMLLKQIVREKSVPLSLSLDSSNAVYADLLEAQTDRLNGYQGRNARDVLRDMEQAIAEVEARG